MPDAEAATSMRNVLHAPLNQLEALAQSLFQSISPPSRQSSFAAPPPVSSFLAYDASMASALHLARRHQIKQRKIEALQEEILGLDKELREIWSELEMGTRELEDIIEEGDERLKAIEHATKESVPHSFLLAFASILSNFTSAPPSSIPLKPDEPAPANIRPPFPTEEQMRRGRLNEGPPLGSLGETRDVGIPLAAPPPLMQGAADEMTAQGRQDRLTAPRGDNAMNVDDLFDLDLNPDF